MKMFTILIMTIFAMANCSNDDQYADDASENIEKISLEISAGQTLRHQLATGISTEGGFSVISQPKHAKVSKIEWNKEARQLEYVYKSKESFAGEDHVKIKEVISIGDSENNTERILAIKIEVN